MWRWLLAVLVVLVMSCGRPPPSARPTITAEEIAARLATYDTRPAAPAGVCYAAVEHVQQYKAPGQLIDVRTAVEVSLSREPRPVRVDGWGPPTPAGNICLVPFRATIGNALQRYWWVWTPATGRVEAQDDATKRLSGW
jgi:hypothetical protein